MATTKVPATVDALIALYQRVLPGVQVIDGPPLVDADVDFVIVAPPTEGGGSVEVTQIRQGGLGNRPFEQFAIWCVVSSYSGDPEIKPRRDRCGQLLAAIDEGLRDDPTLGGVVTTAAVGVDLAWQQIRTPDGTAVEVAFQVSGRVLL